MYLYCAGSGASGGTSKIIETSRNIRVKNIRLENISVIIDTVKRNLKK